VVRASSSIRSDWSTREMKIFWPLTRYLSPLRAAVVWMRVDSEPALGSVTPKACRRSSQVAIFLFLAAVAQQGSHRVHLRVAGGGHPARMIDLLENNARLGDAQARAAVFLGNQRGEPAQFGKLAHERLGIFLLAVDLP